jgi:phage replication-related protein YjqB (UPF0714/DUF867 family)
MRRRANTAASRLNHQAFRAALQGAVDISHTHRAIAQKEKAMRTTRNIPLELAQHQRERGEALTKDDFRRLGYTEEQLTTAIVTQAAALFAGMTDRRAA